MVYQLDRARYRRVQASDDSDEFALHVEHVWAQLLRGNPQQPHYSPSAVRPPVDVYQTDSEVVAVIEAPGMRNQDLRLELGPDYLTVAGEKQGISCARDGVFSQLEIACGPFSRRIELPAPVDPEGIRLSYQDGYIEIRLPRAQRRIERRVRVTLRQS